MLTLYVLQKTIVYATNQHSMKHLFSLLLLLNTYPAISQPYSKTDSVLADSFLHKAWRQPLFSAHRDKLLDSALMIIPTHAYYWQQKSMPLYKAWKYEVGRPYLDSAIKYDPAHWLDYTGFVTCIFQKNYNDALQLFYRAKANPKCTGYVMDHPYNFYIGLCHLQLNHIDSSKYYIENCVNETIKKRGENWVHPNHFFYLGIIQYEIDDYEKAIVTFGKAIKEYKQFADAYYYTAQCYARMGKYKEALANAELASQYFKEGYSIREDNTLYEYYPYQIRKYYLDGMLGYLKEKITTN